MLYLTSLLDSIIDISWIAATNTCLSTAHPADQQVSQFLDEARMREDDPGTREGRGENFPQVFNTFVKGHTGQAGISLPQSRVKPRLLTLLV